MKKICVIFAFILLFSTAYVYADDATVVFDENFQAYDVGKPPLGNWEYDTNDLELGTYAIVETDPLDPDNKVLKYVAGAGITNNYVRFEPVGGKVFLEYRFLLENKPNTVQYPGEITGVYSLMTYQGAYVVGGGNVMNIAPVPDVWHTCRVEMDFLEKRYNLIIDGMAARENWDFSDPDLESIDTFRLITEPAWTMIDDIKISYEGGIVRNYTKISSDKYYYNSSLRGIYNVLLDTEPEEFLKNITFVSGAIKGIYETDGETPWTKRFLEDFAVLKIQSPDLQQDWRVKINIRPWVASISTVQTAKKCVIVYSDSNDVIIQNKKRYIDETNTAIKAYTENNEIFVPLRTVCEAFGYTVGYNAQNQTVTVNNIPINAKTSNVLGRTFVSASDMARIIDKKLLVNEQGTAVFGEKDIEIPQYTYSSFVKEILKRKGE